MYVWAKPSSYCFFNNVSQQVKYKDVFLMSCLFWNACLGEAQARFRLRMSQRRWPIEMCPPKNIGTKYISRRSPAYMSDKKVSDHATYRACFPNVVFLFGSYFWAKPSPDSNPVCLRAGNVYRCVLVVCFERSVWAKPSPYVTQSVFKCPSTDSLSKCLLSYSDAHVYHI